MRPETRLVHVARDPLRDSGAVNPPVYRASTIVYPSLQAYTARLERRYTSFSYGMQGTPTTVALAEAAGHSDLLVGAITVRTEEQFRAIKDGVTTFGDCVSPDVCYETLRGLRTLAVRLQQLEASALAVARWLAGRPEVARVLHPALPGHPGHHVWKRDFLGSSSLFGVLLRTTSLEAVSLMVDGLRLFKIGSSFGGYESLVALPALERTACPWTAPGILLRFHVGLEAVEDLIADLADGLARLNAAPDPAR